MGAAGLAFAELSSAQQQQLIAHLGAHLQSLEELAGARLRVEYTQPGWFRWEKPAGPGGAGMLAPSRVRERTREAALQAAQRIDPAAVGTQVVPTDLSLAVVYALVHPKTGLSDEALLGSARCGTLLRTACSNSRITCHMSSKPRSVTRPRCRSRP